ncbi:Transcription factor gsfR2 [Penicillium rolfsii]|nr:Transcription factor gsfR2 [Penicillium rolfsii]
MSLRVLEAKTATLLQQVSQTTSLEELLASAQALMLFHIIQLFDGDVRQRSIAERNMDTLRTWTTRLQVQAEDLGHASSWEEWIFAESIRRTVIFSLLIDSLYSSLKHGYCTNVKLLSMLPFTAGSKLWDLNTSAAWFTESSQTGSEVVLYGDFSMAWENGRVLGELDYFQKLLLIPCVGEIYKNVLELENPS